MKPVVEQAAPGPFALGADARAELERRVEAALRRARRERRAVIASLTLPIEASLDASAAALAARRPDDRWFCLEQPDRGGFALAALGAAAVLEERGPGRFAAMAARCRALAEGAEAGDPPVDGDAPPGSGPVFVGGFAFADEGGETPDWASFAPAQLVLPELSVARRDGQARLTLTALVEGDDDALAVVGRLAARAASLEPAEMPLYDPDPVEQPRVATAAPPAHFESAVARAVELIGAGEIEKVVLAREVRVHAPAPIDPAPIYGALRGAFPACYCYVAGTPEAAFIGASPELLVRRDGARAQTVALAGTTRRSADPAVDRHLGERLLSGSKEREEQAIVARRIERALRPVSVWVASAGEPVLVKVLNVQHLATPIRAQLSEPVPVLELAGRLHPTPAVGGEPWERARELIPALEGLDRGWYAGTVGWTDLAEDGEFCVAIRCGLLRGEVAHLYAGNGIVRDSVPADELAETEHKLGALLPLLS
ncbi:MAG: isochorismate synthase [Thermoleophilaceae bacterium]|nr:isochorismate synthase [Thermoleophilaceae bacterium]